MFRARLQFLALLVSLHELHGKDVVLLDTTTSRQKTLSWATHSSSRQTGDGWQEESYVRDQLRINWRTYVTCDVMIGQVRNWLRTPFVPRAGANRLYIETRFTMRDCEHFDGAARTCKETFSLYAYEADSRVALNNSSKARLVGSNLGATAVKDPDWNVESYVLVDRIAGDKGRFSKSQPHQGDQETNIEVRSITVSKDGVYFAFLDEGSCTSLLAVKVYYKVCEEVTAGLASFPATHTNAEQFSFDKIEGTCLPNATSASPSLNSDPSGPIKTLRPVSHRPEYLCKSNGDWAHLSFPCRCAPGYSFVKGRCLGCETGFFKNSAGNTGCFRCPDNSLAQRIGSHACECRPGYNRKSPANVRAPCGRPPSKPENLHIVSLRQTRVTLRWSQPSDIGDNPLSPGQVTYTVHCRECSSGVQYVPKRTGLTGMEVTLEGLKPGSVYLVAVFARNDFSTGEKALLDDSSELAKMEFKTGDNVRFSVEHLRLNRIAAQKMELTWTPLATSPETPVEYYIIHQYSKLRDGSTEKLAEFRSIGSSLVFNQLSDSVQYGFKVRAFITTAGWTEWTPMIWGRLTALQTGSSLQEHHIAMIVGSLIACILLLICLAACFYRRFNGKLKSFCDRPKSSDLDVLDSYKSDPVSSPGGCFMSPSFQAMSSAASTSARHLFASPLLGLSSSSPYKPYVDPSNYEDPSVAVQEFASELPPECVFIDEIIGAGEFGEVCKGTLCLDSELATKLRLDNNNAPGGTRRTVAIKTLKPGSSEKEKANFLMEASIMGQFSHPNVIQLVGVVATSEPVMIITNFMPNGSLDTFIRANKGKFVTHDLLQMLRQIALGMKYLSDIGYVHRDLAARNVLVDEECRCKIADFGLSRITEGTFEQVYTTKGGKIPIRWTSPEAITHRKFSSASDVWSFGIVLWEVMSFGERPYWDWSNKRVIEVVEHDYRLPPPMGCPKAVYDLMLRCWSREGSSRPTFGVTVAMIDEFLRCPDLLRTPAAHSDPTAYGLKSLSPSHPQPIRHGDASTSTCYRQQRALYHYGPQSQHYQQQQQQHPAGTLTTASTAAYDSSGSNATLDSGLEASDSNHNNSNGKNKHKQHNSMSRRHMQRHSEQRGPDGSPAKHFPLDCTVHDWLSTLHLNAYIPTFHAAGYTLTVDCLQLAEPGLVKLGITHTPHVQAITESLCRIRNLLNITPATSGPSCSIATTLARTSPGHTGSLCNANHLKRHCPHPPDCHYSTAQNQHNQQQCFDQCQQNNCNANASHYGCTGNRHEYAVHSEVGQQHCPGPSGFFV